MLAKEIENWVIPEKKKNKSYWRVVISISARGTSRALRFRKETKNRVEKVCHLLQVSIIDWYVCKSYQDESLFQISLM